MSKVGLILEGGAMRGVFSAGVTDYLLDKDVYFPYVIGVSAGGGIAANFVSRQIGRSRKVITHENATPYFGIGALRTSRKILDLSIMVERYAREEIPFDTKTFFESDVEFELVATNVRTATAKYFKKPATDEEFYKICEATCAVPFACAPIEIEGEGYLDGSIVDSVPAARAFECGCDKVVIILTGAEVEDAATDYSKVKGVVDRFYAEKYPLLTEKLMKRKMEYDLQMKYLAKLVDEGKAMIIRPLEKSINHFELDVGKVNTCYLTGYDIMRDKYKELMEFMNS